MGDNWHLPDPATTQAEVPREAKTMMGKRAKRAAKEIVEMPNEAPVEIPFSGPPPEEPDNE